MIRRFCLDEIFSNFFWIPIFVKKLQFSSFMKVTDCLEKTKDVEQDTDFNHWRPTFCSKHSCSVKRVRRASQDLLSSQFSEARERKRDTDTDIDTNVEKENKTVLWTQTNQNLEQHTDLTKYNVSNDPIMIITRVKLEYRNLQNLFFKDYRFSKYSNNVYIYRFEEKKYATRVPIWTCNDIQRNSDGKKIDHQKSPIEMNYTDFKKTLTLHWIRDVSKERQSHGKLPIFDKNLTT